MSGVVLKPDTPDTRYALQRLARLKMIVKLEADIEADMMVCEIEGWNKREYIKQLQDLVNRWEVNNETDRR